MSRNSKRIWPYSSSRLSKVIDLCVNGKPIYDFLLVINCNFSRLLPFSRYSRLKIGNCWFYTHPSLVWRSCLGNPSEFLDETYPAKTRGMGLLYGENFIILTSTVFLWYHRLTDRQADGRYTRARKNAACNASNAVFDAMTLYYLNLKIMIMIMVKKHFAYAHNIRYVMLC